MSRPRVRGRSHTENHMTLGLGNLSSSVSVEGAGSQAQPAGPGQGTSPPGAPSTEQANSYLRKRSAHQLLLTCLSKGRMDSVPSWHKLPNPGL